MVPHAMSLPTLQGYLKLLRPTQWLKNLMIFFPPFLGGTFFLSVVRPTALVPFVSFCLASSATYILNDLLDMEHDRNHPEKRLRPLPSGRISPLSARVLALTLAVAAIALAWMVSLSFLSFLLLYGAVSSAYSIRLKEYALVDIFCISAGFLLRLEAGGAAFGVTISEWLFLSVFLLAVFLSTGKRLSEKNRLGVSAANHRKVLATYPEGFLDGTMFMTGGAVLVTYTLYVISRHSSLLLYTVPLCCFGLLRYILRVQSGKGGDPTESLLRDMPLFIVGLVWAVMVGWGIYVP
ncbi:decaprenyl-phosphate phosphoribosyltransferase [Oryzomonas japonica]|uniref:Decaprenyl-phosphate phosphoribosyltransferase n=1 Tax=Oryzomonas japonica TaxID=2603858 RepID=A0A7J4ZQY1_9BACT|nr:decaprenyl-phosphate phosphoribosyltransferase [Oryzomonas japonica]KAB0664891.1 decaprenyl-phosphate phosphoribosyltransferase [Oryzomonas japonica]